MVNYSTEAQRRVDWTFGIAYGDDIDKAKEVLIELLKANDKVLKDPEVFVEVKELADSSVNFAVRAWVKGADYWDVFFYMPQNVYKTFAERATRLMQGFQDAAKDASDEVQHYHLHSWRTECPRQIQTLFFQNWKKKACLK